MADFPLVTPLINGHIWSHASVEVRVAGLPALLDCQEINYEGPADPADVYGTHHDKLGTTKGTRNCTGSMRILGRSWERLREMLGEVGYGERRVPYFIQYGEPGTPVVTDILEGTRIVNVQKGSAVGPDPIVVTLTFNIMRIFENVKGQMYAPKHRVF